MFVGTACPTNIVGTTVSTMNGRAKVSIVDVPTNSVGTVIATMIVGTAFQQSLS